MQRGGWSAPLLRFCVLHTHAAHTLHTRCTHAAHTLHTRCTLAAHTLHPRCTHAAHTLHARCTLAAHTLHPRCTHVPARPIVPIRALVRATRRKQIRHDCATLLRADVTRWASNLISLDKILSLRFNALRGVALDCAMISRS